MRRAFTLLEIVVTLVIASILSVAAFKALEALYLRAARARAVTDLSLQSQTLLAQIAERLYDRIPLSVIGYDPSNGNFEPLVDMDNQSYPVMEWIGSFEMAMTDGAYSAFVDMAQTSGSTIDSPETDGSALSDDYKTKYGTDPVWGSGSSIALIFSGPFDRGVEAEDLKNSFGWHGSEHREALHIDSVSDDGKISITSSEFHNRFIYEKYFLADSAYAVARVADIDSGASCISDLNSSAGGSLDSDALVLFSDYRPWNGETFCADPNGSGQSGEAALLSRHASGFRAWMQNGVIRLSVDLNQSIRGSQSPVHISKQKVVF